MRRQHGQAIVIVAGVLLALLAIVGVGIDAGRAYADQRQLQAAGDAAALAAAGDYHASKDLLHAAQRGAQLFAENVGAGGSVAEPVALPAGFEWGAYSLTIDYRTLPPNGRNAFVATAVHRLPVALMQVLGVGPDMRIAASAAAAVDQTIGRAAMIALAQTGCSGSQDTINFGGNADTVIVGDVISNGTIRVQNNSNVNVQNGTAYYHCPPAPSGITPVGSSPVITVSYPPPGPAESTQRSLSSGYDALPGTYRSVRSSGRECSFLAPGVYTLAGGMTVTGGTVSNELRPPDEALPSDVTKPAANPLWASCNAAITVTAPAGDLAAGTWYVRVTATRTDNGYLRESAGSVCHKEDVKADQSLQVAIPITPGATGFRVYAGSTDCGSARYVKSAPVPANSVKDGTQTVVVTLGRADLTGTCAGPRCTPPANEVAHSGAPPRSAEWPTDLANENLCLSGGLAVACPADSTPGGVALVISDGQAIALSGGTTYLFGTREHGWIVIYRSSTGAPVNDDLTGNGFNKFFGTIYLPNGNVKVAGGATAPITGQLVALTIQVTGTAGLLVQVDTSRTPGPPPPRLVQ